MSKVDTAWLRMEKPTNLMMISGVMVLDSPLSLDDLKQVIRERFLSYPRFSQRAVDIEAMAFWETDPDFDLDWHVRRTSLPGAAGQDELQDAVSQLASTPLDASKPRWQFHLVESFGGGSALITRIHHCYADGIALVQVLLSLTDTSADSARRKTTLDKTVDTGRAHAAHFFDPAVGQLKSALKLGGRLLQQGIKLYQDPAAAGELVRDGSGILGEVAHSLSLSDDPITSLKGSLGVVKRCAWADPLPLVDVKAACDAWRCTVNDVLMATLAGALRSYLLDVGEDIDGLTLRATVPVNLRPPGQENKLGNHFGLVFMDLPVGEANPAARLERVVASMREIKASKQALVTYGALAAVGMAPSSVQRAVLDFLSRKASAVATNVPGPSIPLYLAGAELKQTLFWVPQSGGIGLGASILSYNGEVHFGLMADRKRVAEPASVVNHFRNEFEKLLYIALMEDWSTPFGHDDAEATLEHFGDHVSV